MMTLFFSGYSQKNEQRQERREKIEAIRIAFITKELNLTSSESEKFWPVYNNYQDKLQKLRKDLRPTNRVEDMSDNEADNLINDYLKMEEQKIQLEKDLFNQLRPIIGPQRVILLKWTEDRFKQRLLEKVGNEGGQRMERRRM